MRYITQERAALLLILLVAECIPLMLALVALAALVLFLPNCQAITNFRRRLSGCIARLALTVAHTLIRARSATARRKRRAAR